MKKKKIEIKKEHIDIYGNHSWRLDFSTKVTEEQLNKIKEIVLDDK